MAAQIVREPSAREVDVAVETMRLLADRTRLRIVWALLHGEHSVNELAEHVGMNAAAVSQHLAKLRLAHVVTVRRDGTRSYYSTDDEHVRSLAEQALFHSGHAAAPRHWERRGGGA